VSRRLIIRAEAEADPSEAALRDDGLAYGDLASQARHQMFSQNTTCASRIVVVEQLTFLLFLKWR
jgi:hypothetical protein